jgi:hypothetical protein
MYFKKFYKQLPSRMIRLMEDEIRDSGGGPTGKISGRIVSKGRDRMD